jgi:hypothetical protein
MARARVQSNGRLEDAMATLLQNQALFLGRVSEMDQRLTRIEGMLIEHSRVLEQHSRLLSEILETLPDRIGERFGFQVPRRERPTE